MLSALLLALLFGSPGIVLSGCACGRGAAKWPWPRGVAVGLAFGVVLAAAVATVLGAFGMYSLAAEFVGIAAVTLLVAAASGFRFAWPLAPASIAESVGFVVVVVLASVVFLGRPFEMLVGERDATVYTVSGVGLARQGSLVLHDRTADIIGSDAMRQFYPVYPGQRDSVLHTAQFVKYPGFYYVDTARSLVLPQGLPLLPAVIAIFYGAFGLWGALAANNFVGIVAVLAVLAAGTELVGEVAAVLAAILLAVDLVEVWAARYPVAEILFQMALFAGFAAFLRRDRIGEAIAGFLLGAALLTKIEAALILAPIVTFSAVAVLRRKQMPGRAFWLAFAASTLAAGVYWTFFQVGYFQMAYTFFTRVEGKTISGLVSFHGVASYIALALAVAFVGLGLWAAASAVATRPGLSRSVGRWVAIAVVVLAGFAYFVRPHLAAGVFGQKMTLVWLGWYVSRPVLFIGILGLAHFLWTRADAADLWVMAILLTLSAVFLHFTFVKPTHIYMTRRFVPAILPLVLLSFGYAVARVGEIRFEIRRRLALFAAGALFAGALFSIGARSRHLYRHREYVGLAKQFSDLAASLQDRRLVFLSDTEARNLLGPALEFVFGVPTLVVRPQPFHDRRELIQRWIDEDMPIGAVTMSQQLETVAAAEEFQSVDRLIWRFRALHQVYDRFPDEVWDGVLAINRYAAGPGSDPLYEFWKHEGSRIGEAVCSQGVQLLGGNRFLVHRTLMRCPGASATARTHGYLVAESESATWGKMLDVYGARFVKRDLGGVTLFDDVAPQDAGDAPLAPTGWKLEATHGHGSESSAVDGRLDTRWGSGAPQKPGMTFTVQFPEPTDVSWAKLRMGPFASDRSRPLAFETSVDGERWNRQEVPTVVEGIRWQGRVPEENANGDLDLWVNARGIRFFRLVNLGTSPRFDWSIAELEIDGKPSR
jgi:hypothetical protein